MEEETNSLREWLRTSDQMIRRLEIEVVPPSLISLQDLHEVFEESDLDRPDPSDFQPLRAS